MSSLNNNGGSMKKLFPILLAVCFIFSIKLAAQTAAKAEWMLTDSSGAAVTGNIHADTMFITAPLNIKDYTGSSLFGPAVRINDTTGFGPNEVGPELNRYIQFLIKPQSGFNLHVDSVAFWLMCSGTHGNMHGAVYWDTDTANYTQNNLMDYDSVTYPVAPSTIKGLPDVREDQPTSGMPHDTSFYVGTDVNDGSLFAVRVYPWYNATSSSTTKYVVLYDVRIYGTTSPATAVKKEESLPKVFSLSQNYPNPFNPSTQISFSLDKAGMTNLTVYNMLGQKVATLINGNLPSGEHNITFNADKLTSGIYIYQLTSGSNLISKKMILLK